MVRSFHINTLLGKLKAHMYSALRHFHSEKMKKSRVHKIMITQGEKLSLLHTILCIGTTLCERMSCNESKRLQISPIDLNTQYMRNPTMVYPVKMEHRWNFWLKVSFTISTYTTKIFVLKSLHMKRRSFFLLNLWFCGKGLLSMR